MLYWTKFLGNWFDKKIHKPINKCNKTADNCSDVKNQKKIYKST